MNINKIKLSIKQIAYFINVFDKLSGKVVRNNKFSELFLQKYNLYKDKNNNHLTKTIIDLLGYSDSSLRIIDIIRKYKLDFQITIKAIDILKRKKLIKILQ